MIAVCIFRLLLNNWSLTFFVSIFQKLVLVLALIAFAVSEEIPEDRMAQRLGQCIQFCRDKSDLYSDEGCKLTCKSILTLPNRSTP